MKTLALQGNLLNLFVALAMGGKEDVDLHIPFDEWDCGIVYEGDYFNPQQNVAEIWPEVMRLRLGALDMGNGCWVVMQPVKGMPSIQCTNLLKGYCLALVWSVFGEEVPDVFKSSLYSQVPLTPYNVDFDEPVDSGCGRRLIV